MIVATKNSLQSVLTPVWGPIRILPLRGGRERTCPKVQWSVCELSQAQSGRFSARTGNTLGQFPHQLACLSRWFAIAYQPHVQVEALGLHHGALDGRVDPLGRVAERPPAERRKQHDVRCATSSIDDPLKQRCLIGGIEDQLRECCPVLLWHTAVRYG